MAAEGLVLVDKSAGMTSHDVVDIVRRAYGERSVGHLGTLDPFATGLLVLLVGRATRLGNFIAAEPKIYEAVIRFGFETDTDDATGTPSRSAAAPANDRAELSRALAELTGEIEQVPPAFSAKQVGGRRAYAAARAGETMTLAAARVTVHEWRVRSFDGESLTATIVCAGGTYIRALARDLGRALNSAAHLAELRRTKVGGFSVDEAAGIEDLRASPPPLRRLRVVADD